MKKTDILEVVVRKLSPFILLFGFYVVSHGHLSPGGGFQGGVVLASGIILLILSKGVEPVQPLLPVKAVSLVEMLGLCAFLLTGLIGLAVSGRFLTNIFTNGASENGASAYFILLLNIIIALKVGAGIVLMCFFLLKDE